MPRIFAPSAAAFLIINLADYNLRYDIKRPTSELTEDGRVKRRIKQLLSLNDKEQKWVVGRGLRII